MWVRILQRNRTNRIHQIRWDLPGWLTYSEAECTTVAVWRLEESQESQELLSGKSQKPQNKKKWRCSLSWRLKVWETPGRRQCVLSKAEELGVPCGALQQEQACTLDSLLLGCPSLQVPRLLDGSAPFRVVLYSAHRPTYTPTVSGNLLSDPCRNMLYPFSTRSPIQ